MTEQSPSGSKIEGMVAPLQWEWEDFRSVWKAPSVLGEYAVWTIQDYACFKRVEWDAGKGCGTSDQDGFAAAQSDYATRILSAVPALIDRIEALEGLVRDFVTHNDEGPGLIDCIDNYGDRYTSAGLDATIRLARTTLSGDTK